MSNVRAIMISIVAVGVLASPSVFANEVTIPAGTRLMIGLDEQLDTGENKDGDRFRGFLDASVSVDGQTVLSRGTQVYGRVREVEKAGRFRGKAGFVLDITDLLVDEALVPVVTERLTIDGEKAQTLQKAGVGAAAGAVVGAAVGGGAVRGAVLGAAGGAAVQAFTGGRQIVLELETLLEFRTTQPLSIDVP